MQWAGSVLIAVLIYPALDRLGRLVGMDKEC
jgi:hypothetical protein